MAHECRLLETGAESAAFNMGLDEAVLESVSAGRQRTTLRLYAWKPAAVSIGYFQGMDEEVDLASCAAHGVDVVRRLTGGGAVFHQAEITYSIVVSAGHSLFVRSILASYERLCAGVVEALRLLGVRASFAPINDIVAEGRKISGNAQTRKMGCILQHGTVILDVDVDLMFDLLKVPSEKAKGKLIHDVKERVTSLRQLRGSPVSYEEAADAMGRGFAAALDLDYGEGIVAPTEEERNRALELAATKFGARSWNFKR